MQPSYWNTATDELSATDPVMAGFIRDYHGEFLVSRGDPFGTLLRSIIGQQISVKAADAITGRLYGLVGEEPQPAALLARSEEELRAIGLSRQKISYLHSLARHFEDGRVHPGQWDAMEDENIIRELVDIKGIGRWTAEMFLIFHLMRPDVFPVDDIGLQKAVERHYSHGERLPPKKLKAYGERWRPWRSVATWYLWRSLDPVPVAY